MKFFSLFFQSSDWTGLLIFLGIIVFFGSMVLLVRFMKKGQNRNESLLGSENYDRNTVSPSVVIDDFDPEPIEDRDEDVVEEELLLEDESARYEDEEEPAEGMTSKAVLMGVDELASDRSEIEFEPYFNDSAETDDTAQPATVEFMGAGAGGSIPDNEHSDAPVSEDVEDASIHETYDEINTVETDEEPGELPDYSGPSEEPEVESSESSASTASESHDSTPSDYSSPDTSSPDCSSGGTD